VVSKVEIVHDVLHIKVNDSGPGIHPDDLPHLFDRYFQTTRPEKAAEGGTGIGLALCKEYTQLLGGTLEVNSKLGGGTVFSLSFPVTPVEASSLSEEEKEEWEDRGRQTIGEHADITPLPVVRSEKTPSEKEATMLLVEDNPELQDYIKLILSEKYRILTAENGREALEVLGLADDRQPGSSRDWSQSSLKSQKVDLILSDLMMPVMDGFQLLEKLKAEDATRQLPVIMLTARADLRDKLKALRIGVDDYLLKPFEEDELRVRVENLLKNQEVRKEENKSREQSSGLDSSSVSGSDREWLESFENFVLENLSDHALNVARLADEFTMSESTLLRQLKRLTGLTPNRYLQDARLNQARILLENQTFSSIVKVASEVGYSDPRSFSRSFKKRFGKSPSEH
jgi:DNA-binding response OmpR family regulator